jgi:hypothetical protein
MKELFIYYNHVGGVDPEKLKGLIGAFLLISVIWAIWTLFIFFKYIKYKVRIKKFFDCMIDDFLIYSLVSSFVILIWGGFIFYKLGKIVYIFLC